jgi:hypothetical protein
MTYQYTHLFQAFIETVGHIHGATFNDSDIDTLHIDGKPADAQTIATIKARAEEIARG